MHAVVETLEEYSFFGYDWKDKNKMTSILGFHLIILGCGALLLVLKATFFGGLYDPWAPVVAMFVSLLTRRSTQLSSSVMCSSPFGGQGSIVSVDNLEDVVGGHIWVALILIGGGIFSFSPSPLLGRVAYIGLETYLSTAWALCPDGLYCNQYVWFNNTVYPSEFYGPGPRSIKLRH